VRPPPRIAATALFCAGIAALLAAQGAGAVLAIDEGRDILPVARVDAGVWTAAGRSAAWPAQWARWTSEGASLPITLETVAQSGACEATPRLRSTGPAAVPPGAPRRALLGIATAGALVAGPVAAIDAGSEAWARVAPEIERLFEVRERELRLAPGQVARAPIVIDSLYASPDDASRVYYFEASRTVPDDPADVDADDPRGVLRVAVNGWLRATGTTTGTLGARADLAWEQLDRADRAPARPADLTPVGLVTNQAQQVWLMRSTGPRRRLLLYDASGPKVALLLRIDEPSC
jgi:hypothetical protein